MFPAVQDTKLSRSYRASLKAWLQAINISPRWGEIRQAQLVALQLESTNDNWKISYISIESADSTVCNLT